MHQLPQAFIVQATQNPIEQEGTYPLPEAQLDRFMVQLTVGNPSREEADRRRDGDRRLGGRAPRADRVLAR
jgi:MoxR-like ATPase